MLTEKKISLRCHSISGLSTVELLIAMVLGFFLITGILQVYISNHKTSTILSGFSAQQENARVSLTKIVDSLLLAGHFGGILGKDVNVVGSMTLTGVGSCNQSWIVDTRNAIQGYEGASTTSSISDLPTGCISSTHYVANSDILTVRFASASDAMPISSLENSKVYLRSSTTGTSMGGEILLGSNISSSQIGDGVDGVGIYNFGYETHMYYLRPCSALNGTACEDGISTLVRMELDGTSLTVSPIAEGIEQLQFEYGFDSDSDYIADQYFTADNVTDWRKVVSARFSMVVRSQNSEAGYEDDNSYDLTGGYEYTPSDDDNAYRRKVITRVVQLRNMSRG